MSKIKKVTVSLGHTIQTKPYEAFRVDMSLTSILEIGDDWNDVYDDLTKKIKEKIESEVENMMP